MAPLNMMIKDGALNRMINDWALNMMFKDWALNTIKGGAHSSMADLGTNLKSGRFQKIYSSSQAVCPVMCSENTY
jgi:hypothetical protein